VAIDISRRLAHEPASVIEARAALSPLERAVDPDTFQTLRLLVTELVGNSVRHAESRTTEEIELSVHATRGMIRIEVTDAGSEFAPLRRSQEVDATSGRGLQIVQALCDRWGTVTQEHTRVWCELLGAGQLARELDAPTASSP